ncbi:tripartite tricarboxylate transporter TctB family protein [Gynuella sunshinyii]|uniref:DUF1468 domain-containing protein n=1 Tax=Gynuella sunshinyii YC6258 TaxID=1445510 RepID=A0A0C5VSV1_9GAMM|nr:tripartite tricarboxylate transporter TctB family protein [Gynuella sunshinyii]AJQ97256.1 hypothetical Protein YC6258_05226 [Gynuella sunshinyii YC6258]
MSDQPVTKPGEIVFGFFLLALSLLLLWQSYAISGFSSLSSPGAFPMAASAIMVVSSCVFCIHNLQRPKGEISLTRFFDWIIPRTVAAVIGCMLVFSVVLESVGFLVTALVFLTLTIAGLNGVGFGRSLVISIFSLIIIYVVFRLVFKVILPEGWIPERAIIAWFEQLFVSVGS